MGTMWTPGVGSAPAPGLTGLSPEKLDAVLKSLETAAPTGNTGTTAGAVMQLESVEPTLANISYDPTKHFAFMRWMREKNLYTPANALLHQYAQVKSTFNPLIAVATGNLNPGLDRAVQLERLSKQLRLFNAKGSYEFFLDMLGNRVLQLPNAQGTTTPKTMAYMYAATQLLGGVTRDTLYGDSAINANEPDGFFKQITATGTAGVQVIDLRGRAPTSDFLRHAIARLQERALGIPTTCFGSPLTMESLATEIAAKQIIQSGDGRVVVAGNPVQRIQGSLSSLDLRGDLFFGGTFFPLPAVADGNSSKPAQVAFSVQPVAGGAGTSQWTADDIGTYIYQAVPVSQLNGHPLPTVSNSVALTDITQNITFTLSDVSCDEFFIYRSDKNGAASTCKFWKRVVKGSTTTAVVDTNETIAGKGKMLLTSDDIFHLAFAHMGGAFAQSEGNGSRLGNDMMAVAFGLTNFSQQFALVLNGAPYIMAPTQSILVNNVGEADTSIIL